MEIKSILLPTNTLRGLQAKRRYYLAAPAYRLQAYHSTMNFEKKKKKIRDVISKGNQFLRHEMSTVLSDYRTESQNSIPVGQYCRKHRRVSSLFPIQGLPSF